MDLIKQVLKMARVSKGKNFYELGSGDGRVVYQATHLGASSYGIEQSWLRVFWSRWQARKRGLKKAHFLHGNIFDRHYYPADIVYIYLLQKAVDRLEIVLKSELKKDAVVITQTYHFKNWQPYQQFGKFWLYRA